MNNKLDEIEKPDCFGNHADRDPGCKKCPVEHQCEYGLVDAYYKMNNKAMLDEMRELVLEIRQYLCNTEFAPEPFKEPVDADVLTKEFPKKILQTFEQFCKDNNIYQVIEIKDGSIQEVKLSE